MKAMKIWYGVLVLLHGGAAFAQPGGQPQVIPVAGNAVLLSDTMVVHSSEPTASGLIERSTSVVKLTGDVSGLVLFHATTEIDFFTSTLVNTGTQLFSGTIAGSDPVILHDDQFVFVVNLATGDIFGDAPFDRSKDAPHRSYWYECNLYIVGVSTPNADDVSEYSGECIRRGVPD
jgi:hypothetical protein